MAAAEVGFVIPQTLLTNCIKAAHDFAAIVDGDLAIKSLGAISVLQDQSNRVIQYGIFTRRINSEELIEFSDKISHMPTLFQQFFSKQSEMRITCVGEEVFACRIQTRHGDITGDDYRFDTANLQHTAIQCPELTKRLHAYMNAFGLNFGCFDFIVSEAGEPIFLECNCNGQWLWVENLTGQPIGEAIANQLMTRESSKRFVIPDNTGPRLRPKWPPSNDGAYSIAKAPSGDQFRGD